MAGKHALRIGLLCAAMLGGVPSTASAQYYSGDSRVSYGPSPGHADYLGSLSINDWTVGLSTAGDFRVQLIDAFRAAGYHVESDTQRIVVHFDGYAPRINWTGGYWNLRIDRYGNTLVLMPFTQTRQIHHVEQRVIVAPPPVVVQPPVYCPPPVVVRPPVYYPPPVVVRPPVYCPPPVIVRPPVYCPPPVVVRPPVYCPPPRYHYGSGTSIHFSIGSSNRGYSRPPTYTPPSRGHDRGWGGGGHNRGGGSGRGR
ncbi:MAG: hypothetical protein KIT24_01845 [Phycisphaeraceae bacterium]|nr:hypothetical protein [Phycisphaeraceae bacterium]